MFEFCASHFCNYLHDKRKRTRERGVLFKFYWLYMLRLHNIISYQENSHQETQGFPQTCLPSLKWVCHICCKFSVGSWPSALLAIQNISNTSPIFEPVFLLNSPPLLFIICLHLNSLSPVDFTKPLIEVNEHEFGSGSGIYKHLLHTRWRYYLTTSRNSSLFLKISIAISWMRRSYGKLQPVARFAVSAYNIRLVGLGSRPNLSSK